MKRYFFDLALIYTLILFSCSGPEKQTTPMAFSELEDISSVGFSPERLAVLDSFLQSKIEDQTIPHIVTFVARKGKVVHHKSYGKMSETQTMSTNGIFRIASQTKAIITVGLMQLFEKGYFLLDDPVSKYIPAFQDAEILTDYNAEDSSFTTRKSEKEITVRHLLTHTAGIPYGLPIYVNAGIPMLNSLEDLTLEEVIPRLAELPIVHEPGEQFTYGLNTDILGYLIEVLSKLPLDQYLRQEIFNPLGMTDTYFYLPDEKHDRLVSLYEKQSADSPLKLSEHPTDTKYPITGAQKFFSGGAGLVGTIKDYAKFCQMLLNGGSFNNQQILSPHTIQMMTSNQIGDLQVWNRPNKFGLGFEIITQNQLTTLPGSEGAFKWGGAYATDYFIDPEKELVFLFYTNIRPFYYYDELFKRCRIMTYSALVE